ncbi:CDP-glycerol glycerophosphotransferase family protein [Enterococcus gallinarum]|uniref:CDP-glycerol glycerophosphotransferase family protein n=1 Tax=Enterococcus gallinarum TaxID=1353 RepID=UPI00288CBEAF|nr:CDP-glycerol glycerophosphotransferase family protein [Enterococcus gallinarum]MDT2722985.1 CDP-glycerol glycerophosphotransferase family protein [Enterococcus gallinarum]
MNIDFKCEQSRIVIINSNGNVSYDDSSSYKMEMVLTHLVKNITKKISIIDNKIDIQDFLKTLSSLEKGKWIVQLTIGKGKELRIYNVKLDPLFKSINSPFFEVGYEKNECLLLVKPKKIVFTFLELNKCILTLKSSELLQVDIEKIYFKALTDVNIDFKISDEQIMIDLTSISRSDFIDEYYLDIQYSDDISDYESNIICSNTEHKDQNHSLCLNDESNKELRVSSKGKLSIVDSRLNDVMIDMKTIYKSNKKFDLYIQNQQGELEKVCSDLKNSSIDYIFEKINNIIKDTRKFYESNFYIYSPVGGFYKIEFDENFAGKLNRFRENKYIILANENNSMFCRSRGFVSEVPIFGLVKPTETIKNQLILMSPFYHYYLINSFYFVHRRTKTKINSVPFLQEGDLIKINLSKLNESIYKLRGLYDLYVEYTFGDKLSIKKVTDSMNSEDFSLEDNIFSHDFSVYQKLYIAKDRGITVYGSSLNAKVENIRENKDFVILNYQLLLSSLEIDKVKLGKVSIKNTVTLVTYKLDDSFLEKYNNGFLVYISKNELLKKMSAISNQKFCIEINFFHKEQNYLIQINENNFEKFPPQKYKRYPEFQLSEDSSIHFSFLRNDLLFYISSNKSINTINIRKNVLILENLFDEEVKLVGLKGNQIHEISKGEKKGKYLNFVINENFLNSLKMNNGNFKLFVVDKKNNLISINKGKLNKKTVSYKNCTDGAYKFSFFTRSEQLYLDCRYLVTSINRKYRFKNLIAQLSAFISRKIFKSTIWLVGENFGISHHDNGYMFFKSFMNSKVPEKSYFVTRQLSDFEQNTRLVAYDSFKHLYLYHASSKLVVSHGVRDVIPSLYHYDKKNEKPIYHLQHGIIAMKKVYFSPNSYNGKMRKMVVSSQKEANILMEQMNFEAKNILVSGLTRYDYLDDSSKKTESREVFLMPTWREWLVESDNIFEQSDFYKHYVQLLNDSELSVFFAKHNIILKFLPHIEMRRRYGKYFTSSFENIVIVDSKKESVQDLIKSASLLITDYSSVAFDFSYLDKPVIFFQFDNMEYMTKRGAFIDFNKELFGPKCSTYEELKTTIMHLVENNFSVDDNYKNLANQYFDFHDKENFFRTYQGIKRDSI